jgi:shikimate 5-dehydrogenase
VTKDHAPISGRTDLLVIIADPVAQARTPSLMNAAPPFLAEAARRGCAVHHGEPMLAAQIGLMLEFMLPRA